MNAVVFLVNLFRVIFSLPFFLLLGAALPSLLEKIFFSPRFNFRLVVNARSFATWLRYQLWPALTSLLAFFLLLLLTAFLWPFGWISFFCMLGLNYSLLRRAKNSFAGYQISFFKER